MSNKRIETWEFLLINLRVFSRWKHANFSLKWDFLRAKTHFLTKEKILNAQNVYYIYVTNKKNEITTFMSLWLRVVILQPNTGYLSRKIDNVYVC
mgnify:CR=1 FL=1